MENKEKRNFIAVYKKEKGMVLAWVAEVPGVNTQGRTLREAKNNLKEALALILETNTDLGIDNIATYREEISVPA